MSPRRSLCPSTSDAPTAFVSSSSSPTFQQRILCSSNRATLSRLIAKRYFLDELTESRLSSELNRWVVHAVIEHLACQPMAVLRLHLQQTVLRFSEVLHRVFRAKRRRRLASGLDELIVALLHVRGIWLPPVSTISELHRPSEQLATVLATVWSHSPKRFRAEVVLHGVVQRVQTLLRTCCDKVAVRSDDVAVTVHERHRRCFNGCRTISDQCAFVQPTPCSGSCSSCLC